MTPDELKEVEQFAAEIVEYERLHADPARDAAEDAEWAKLQAQYPGEFVAYRDSWDGKALTRTVLAHTPDLAELVAVAGTWPVETQDTVKVDYFDPQLPPPVIRQPSDQPRASA